MRFVLVVAVLALGLLFGCTTNHTPKGIVENIAATRPDITWIETPALDPSRSPASDIVDSYALTGNGNNWVRVVEYSNTLGADLYMIVAKNTYEPSLNDTDVVGISHFNVVHVNYAGFGGNYDYLVIRCGEYSVVDYSIHTENNMPYSTLDEAHQAHANIVKKIQEFC